jgi:hypothetical protein
MWVGDGSCCASAVANKVLQSRKLKCATDTGTSGVPLKTTNHDSGASTKTLPFWDKQYFNGAGLQNGATLRLNKPQKLGLVVKPERPREFVCLGGYDKVLKIADEDYRL